MNEVVGPLLPVMRGPEVVVIPRGAVEAGTPVWEALKAEFALRGPEVAVEVRRVDVVVKGPFLHRGGHFGDTELQSAGFIPNRNRLDEWARGKDAVPYGADTAAVNLRANGIREAGLEEPILDRRQFVKAHDVPPHHLGRRIDFDG